MPKELDQKVFLEHALDAVFYRKNKASPLKYPGTYYSRDNLALFTFAFDFILWWLRACCRTKQTNNIKNNSSGVILSIFTTFRTISNYNNKVQNLKQDKP